jgi:hypothetical protein
MEASLACARSCRQLPSFESTKDVGFFHDDVPLELLGGVWATAAAFATMLSSSSSCPTGPGPTLVCKQLARIARPCTMHSQQ